MGQAAEAPIRWHPPTPLRSIGYAEGPRPTLRKWSSRNQRMRADDSWDGRSSFHLETQPRRTNPSRVGNVRKLISSTSRSRNWAGSTAPFATIKVVIVAGDCQYLYLYPAVLRSRRHALSSAPGPTPASVARFLPWRSDGRQEVSLCQQQLCLAAYTECLCPARLIRGSGGE